MRTAAINARLREGCTLGAPPSVLPAKSMLRRSLATVWNSRSVGELSTDEDFYREIAKDLDAEASQLERSEDRRAAVVADGHDDDDDLDRRRRRDDDFD